MTNALAAKENIDLFSLFVCYLLPLSVLICFLFYLSCYLLSRPPLTWEPTNTLGKERKHWWYFSAALTFPALRNTFLLFFSREQSNHRMPNRIAKKYFFQGNLLFYQSRVFYYLTWEGNSTSFNQTNVFIETLTCFSLCSDVGIHIIYIKYHISYICLASIIWIPYPDTKYKLGLGTVWVNMREQQTL